MNTPETTNQPATELVVVINPPETAEQDTAQLLKDLETTVNSFKELFSEKYPALCHALEVVLDYCQKKRVVTFTTRDLIQHYGTLAVRIRTPRTGLTARRFQPARHRSYLSRQRNNPDVFTSNTYNIMAFIRRIIDLITSQNDKVKFSVTFQIQRSDNPEKKRERFTCKVVRN